MTDQSASGGVPAFDQALEPSQTEEPAWVEEIRTHEGQRRALLESYERIAGERSYRANLEAAASRLLEEPAPLEIGDVVQWKRGLKQGVIPEYGRPMIYMGPHSKSGQDLFSSISDELSDVLVGFIDGDREFVVRLVDRRRLMLVADGDLDR